jgi:thiol-disulfide isomerase/thioredoxin
MKKALPWIIVVVVVAGLFYWSAALKAVPSGKYDELAKCVADKGMTMYGAYWCPHCKAEKARFGDSFKYVPYVECTENAALCEAKGVRGYPTWISASGQKFEGELGLEKISEVTACPLPIE